LFHRHPALAGADLCVIVEDPLFFSQFRFHSQKLILHRASMKYFAQNLAKQNMEIQYVESHELKHSADIGKLLKQRGVAHVQFVDPCDDWLQQHLIAGLQQCILDFTQLDDPCFLTPSHFIDQFAEGRTRIKHRAFWFFTDFYIAQRKRAEILVDERGKPIGGKWSFDTENRKKLPRGISVPAIDWPSSNAFVREATEYVARQFPQAIGAATPFRYPVDRRSALKLLDDFIEHRFAQFGDYEDAIDSKDSFLFHSVLTPALNIGLISPQEVIDAALQRIDRVPINSLEGFIRQVIGWREFIRAVYIKLGRRQRMRNFWQHGQPMPASFYDGTTGIEPFDAVVRRVLKNAYCHHIERLMVLGNFMLLCEVSPDAIYRWFMELFIDAYDWVMVPNVYGMSQYADGGMITTKPYISGSAYILKMSNFKKGDWCPIWDALYWNFIDKHRDFFSANPRMSVMVKQCERMGEKLNQHRKVAAEFLEKLHRH
jgi:deoxyribodipyrimidine photolyase-related protein